MEKVVNTIKLHTIEILDSAGLHLDTLPKKDPPVPVVFNGSGSVKILDEKIRAALAKGYTIDDIIDELKTQGVELSKPTIKKNLTKPPKNQKNKTKKPAKKTTKTLVNKTQGQANNATPQENHP